MDAEPPTAERAEGWLERTTKELGIPFRSSSSWGTEVAPASGRSLKAYPSFYASMEQRAALTQALEARSRIVPNVTVQGVWRARNSWVLALSDGSAMYAKNVVLASGRFGAVAPSSPVTLPSRRAQRLEVGVRIEQRSDLFFLKDSPLLDPKIIWTAPDPSIQWRTFCCCRDGEVVSTASGSIRTHSGRGDCPSTGRSNVGFLVRTTDPVRIEENWKDVICGVSRGRLSSVSLQHVMADRSISLLRDYFGDFMGEYLYDGMSRLAEEEPSITGEDTTVHIPCVEGVGWYPTHDSRLQASSDGIWVAGDCTGSFRGIVAALISGRLAGSAIVEELEKR